MNDSPDCIRVLIVDDHPFIRLGIRAALAGSKDINVIAEVDNGEEAAKVAVQMNPDVILMDIGLSGNVNGIEAASTICRKLKDTKVVMLTSHQEHNYVSASLSVGAVGYVLKGATPERLQLAIRSAHAGAFWLDSLVGKMIASQYSKNNAAHTQETVDNGNTSQFRLSEREREVLQLLASGMSNQEVAFRLNISVSTAKTHVRNILKRLGVVDRTQAAIKALHMRIVND